MPDLPTRLLVISARVPEGDECHGCEFLAPNHSHCDLYQDFTQYKRLPACRERDGWVAYPPGSGVAELVEAAKVYARAWSALEDAKDNDADFTQAQLRATQARWDMQTAARKVAKETP